MRRLEKGSTAGLLVGGLAILAGLRLEGGSLGQILQPTAAVIVLGGTLGAVLVQFPLAVVQEAMRRLHDVFTIPLVLTRARMDHLLRLGLQARRGGLVSLDPILKSIDDPFFRKTLMLAVDGMSARDVREIMDLELARLEEDDERAARVWEAAGGFAPTVGILGAVLGLIQVMQRLSDIGDVGRGIAVAFVATLYGVGLANLLFIPLAGKLRLRAREAQVVRETTLEGVIAMIEGASPRTMREKLGANAGERASASLAQMAAR